MMCRIQQECVVALEVYVYQLLWMRHWDTFGCHWCLCKAQFEGQVYSNKVVECKSRRDAHEDYAYVLFGDEDIPPIRVSVFAIWVSIFAIWIRIFAYESVLQRVDLSVFIEIHWLESFGEVISVMMQWRWNIYESFFSWRAMSTDWSWSFMVLIYLEILWVDILGCRWTAYDPNGLILIFLEFLQLENRVMPVDGLCYFSDVLNDRRFLVLRQSIRISRI